MSEQDINVVLEPRKTVRKRLNQVRQEGNIPAVIHMPGRESVSVQGKYLELLNVYKNAGKHNPVNITLGDEKVLAMIKQVDFEPKKHQLRHIVFGEIKKGQKVKAEVPVVVSLPDEEEQTPAERNGLIINRVIDSLEIEAIPSKLIDKLEVDGSKLIEVGDKLHLSDIKVPEGVEIVRQEDDEEDKTIVVVDAPRAAIEEEQVDETEGEEGEDGTEAGADHGESKESDEQKPSSEATEQA